MLVSEKVREIALVWFTAQVIIFPIIQATRCFWRDNSLALDEYEPCFPTRANSGCCGTNKKGDQINDICLSNGLCYAQVRPYTGLILQNTCTDQSWKSSDCPKICPEDMRTTFGIHVLPCPRYSNRHWCCSSNGSDCCDNAFEMDMGTLMLPSDNAPTTVSGKVSTSTATVFSTVTSKIKTPGGGSDEDKQKTTLVGAGVGAGLGACILAMAGALWFQRRMYEKRLRESKAIQAQTFDQNYAPVRVMPPAELPPNYQQTVYEMPAGSPGGRGLFI
ncbi:hypothetical protein P170DRAFT_458610 [Aspergillus steynii IBT 23096]|uniref:Mid2 domain-containing protein n=1 Tax=Aspergillus steynii IBT 23096 TaxID=1392250 RepID=A0A2I2FWK9_9EURO|nr:uncharacterized protein P170DRAFT_458610 [Aspergillus steynii IBT 23096]PLB45020.1 hypothetical protein P170DRAFT_458610 [Aspergillus steynii IBT 23096]